MKTPKTLDELKMLAMIARSISVTQEPTFDSAKKLHELREAIAAEALRHLEPATASPNEDSDVGTCSKPTHGGYPNPVRAEGAAPLTLTHPDTDRLDLMEKAQALASFRESSDGRRWQMLTPTEISMNLHLCVPFHYTVREAIDALLARLKAKATVIDRIATKP